VKTATEKPQKSDFKRALDQRRVGTQKLMAFNLTLVCAWVRYETHIHPVTREEQIRARNALYKLRAAGYPIVHLGHGWYCWANHV